jgi:hypothetical protein
MVNLNSLVDEMPGKKHYEYPSEKLAKSLAFERHLIEKDQDMAKAKTVQQHEYVHIFGNQYDCTSGNSGRAYRVIVEDNLVFYSCQCKRFSFRKECSHGSELCERLGDGESFPEAYPSRFDKPVKPWRVTSDSPFDFDNAPLLDSKPAKRKPTLEELITY